MTKDYKIEVRVNAVHIRLPIYRIWLDEELMCERTFWPNPERFFINETLMVALPPGPYKLRFELVDPALGSAWMERVAITDIEKEHTVQDHGIGRIKNNEQELLFTV